MLLKIMLLGAILLGISSMPAEARRKHRLPWCGIYLGKHLGMLDRKLWIARNWKDVGARASGPCEGCIVVWPHHVGIIKGRTDAGEWIVHSGNDGGAIRTRPRSIARAIAFRRI